MARKKKQPEGSPGAPLFMATYGDMVTLLLCFFVLLYSFSSLDVKKFEQIAQSMNMAFSITQGGRPTPAVMDVSGGEEPSEGKGPADTQTEGQKSEISHQVLAMVREAIKSEQLEDEIQIRADERGVAVSMSEQLLFDETSAILHPEALRILYKIGAILETMPNHIAVEGHTDNLVPPASAFGSNWHLSAARAAAVTAYLENEVGLTEDRLEAVGLGSRKPVVPNDTLEHRSLNRRVDMVILSEHSIR